MKFPEKLAINAYDSSSGAPPGSDVPDTADLWALRNKPDIGMFLASDDEADLRNWRHPNVGWGLVVPANPGCSAKESAELADYERDPIRDLWEARGRGPVFRYDHSRTDRLVLIRSARDNQDVLIKASPVGLGKGCVPRYLLIYGEPAVIPWDLQYAFNENRNCFVGRLPFRGDDARNYVKAATDGFSKAGAARSAAVVWSPVWDDGMDYGMSRLMHDGIAAPVAAKMGADSELTGLCFLDGAKREATAARLIHELGNRRPAMVISTSHGDTGPLLRPAAMPTSLGLPLDDDVRAVTTSDLLGPWTPAGAIWYAHACCSAGSDAATNFEGLFAPDTTPDRLVRAVAKLGSLVSPLPRALLTAEHPVRAFVGHVEPTFNYSLTSPTGAPITHALTEALYDHLYRRQPETIGMAFRLFFDRIGEMYGIYNSSYREYNKGRDEEMAPWMVWSLLAANDFRTTVILGDPAVTLPAP